MRQIYTQASKTLIWLGDASLAEEEALGLLPSHVEKLEKMGEEAVSAPFGKAILSTGPDKEVVNVLTELPQRTNAVWRILGGIVHRPWSRRLWVLQEIVLAEDVIVLCGSTEVSWDYLVRFVRAMMRHGMMRRLRDVEEDDDPQQIFRGSRSAIH